MKKKTENIGEFFRKIFYILGERKKKMAILSLLFLFIAGLDFLGIGLFIPLLSIITSPEKIQNSAFYIFLVSNFNFTFRSFTLILVLFIFFIFLLRNILFILSNAYVLKYSYSQMAHLRERLLDAYMKLPYIWHLEKNSSRIVQNIISETGQFCNNVMIPFLRLFGQLFVLIFLIILILKTNFLFAALLILAIFGVFFSFFVFSRKVSPELGKKISQSNEYIIKNINQGLGSIKESKITNQEDFFIKNVKRGAKEFAKASTKYKIINFSPVSIVEFAIVTYILAWIGVYFILGLEVQTLIPLLTIVVLAGLRVLPFMSSIMQSINNFHNSSYFVNKLYNDLRYLENSGKDVVLEKIKDFKEIEIKNLFFRYEKDDILKNIDLKIKKKEIIGVTGKTGSGKTTLINILLGLLENKRGEIIVDGKKYPNKYMRHLMAYIPQDIFLLDDTIKNNIAFGIEEKDINKKRVIESLKSAQAYEFVKSLSDGLETIIGENGVRLSGGQRQRLGIARALYHDRKIFVFDEATSSLDYKTEQKVQDSILSLKDKKTIVMIAHRLRTLKECDRVYVIDKGKIVKIGNYQEISQFLS